MVSEQTETNHLNALKAVIQTLSPAWPNQLHQKAAAADGESIIEFLKGLSPEYRD